MNMSYELCTYADPLHILMAREDEDDDTDEDVIESMIASKCA